MVNLTPIYIAISITALLIIALLVFFVKKNKKQKKLSALTGLSFGFVIAGLFFTMIKVVKLLEIHVSISEHPNF